MLLLLCHFLPSEITVVDQSPHRTTQILWLPLHRQNQVYQAFMYDNFAGLRVSSRKICYIDKWRCEDDRQSRGSAFVTEDRLHALAIAQQCSSSRPVPCVAVSSVVSLILAAGNTCKSSRHSPFHAGCFVCRSFFETGSHCAALAGLKLTEILLSFWDTLSLNVVFTDLASQSGVTQPCYRGQGSNSRFPHSCRKHATKGTISPIPHLK